MMLEMKYGNDIDKILFFLNCVNKDIDNINYAIIVINVYVEILDKSYEFKEGYESSLTYKYYCYMYEKMAEIYDDDSMTLQEKFEHCDKFDESLTEKEKGELHVQSSIGKPDKVLLNKTLMKVMMGLMKNGKPFEKANKFQQCLMNTAAVAEEKQSKASLEENLKWYGNILESDFYKSIQNHKNM